MLITWKETAVWTDYTHYICTFRLNGRHVSLQQTANDHMRCWVTKQQQSLDALNCSMLTHFSLMNKVIQGTIYCDFFPFFRAKESPQRAAGLKCHRGVQIKAQGPVNSHTFLSFLLFICAEAPLCVHCGLIKSSPGLCRGKRMCLLQHFYAIYNVQFVVLIEPSRPIEIAASALSKSLGVN